METLKHKLLPREESRVLFIDMNSFFASCEQQENFYLRGRPVAVCVYTGRFGCVIAPSIEAKLYGVKTGMRLNEAILLCPELIPIETHPDKYRSYHIKIMKILKAYCNDVHPKSIDEAVVDLTNYQLIHKDVLLVAKAIKRDINEKVGDWLKCSIGIAPTVFLSKLASDIKKPDGLTLINKENLDSILAKLKLTDLSGISTKTEIRLKRGGISTPLQMRYTSPENLKAIFKSVLGYHWHCRLNFIEIDTEHNEDYKSMQAMRHLSAEQRASVETISELIIFLCLTLERRMVLKDTFANTLGFSIKYANGERWDDYLTLSNPIQDGADIYSAFVERIKTFELAHKNETILHTGVTSLCVYASNFINKTLVQYNLFEDNSKKDSLRTVVYNLKRKFGKGKILRAIELKEDGLIKDLIGFGSIKDLQDDPIEFIN